MTVDDWLKRIRLGEDSTLELKRVVMRSNTKVEDPHPDSLADELAAMANTNGGTLILGIDDVSKQVLGIAYAALDTVEKWLAELCQTRVDPPLDIITQHIELPDAAGQHQPVIIVQVPRSLIVHKSPNGYFKRIAHAKREMKPDVLARLFQQRSQSRLIRFEEQVVPATALEQADPLLMRTFVRANEGDPTLQLRRLHLLADDEGLPRLSVAGVLLCTTKPTQWLPSAYIQAVAYSGTVNDPSDQLDAKDFEGPLDRQIWDAFDFVRLNMKVPARKFLGRIDYPQYSLRAVFEALVNAVVHRDYSIWGGRVRLHMFADRLELYSPGALPNSMTIETMQMMSMPRNEVLSSLFSRYYPVRDSGLGREYLMDRRGSGVDVILAESERLSGRSPVYDNIADIELRLTIYAASLSE
ncbi:transcriptional regulator [Candidatus Methylobacter oryzae]|uniref:Transcriptional regulator n=2 Tax=Candidatus Methylobacter oryzae TaxID=2497749 RepID=A0ABY3CBK2_9GAMM|nr:transcriptional regulator [Candidatus Methylobacter oryzae]